MTKILECSIMPVDNALIANVHDCTWTLGYWSKNILYLLRFYIVNRSELAGCLLQVSLLTWSDRKRMKDAVYKNFIIIIIIMIFWRQKNGQDLNLMMAGTPIQRKSEARFLGVIVDEKLNWTIHIKTVKSKMSRYIGIMDKIKSFLPKQARLQIFHSLVQSHINFCSLVCFFRPNLILSFFLPTKRRGCALLCQVM